MNRLRSSRPRLKRRPHRLRLLRRPKRPTARGEAILAAATVDKSGRLVETPAAVISSFAWGLPRALRGDLVSLAAWRSVEEEITEALDAILRRDREASEDEEALALDQATIQEAYGWIVNRLAQPDLRFLKTVSDALFQRGGPVSAS